MKKLLLVLMAVIGSLGILQAAETSYTIKFGSMTSDQTNDILASDFLEYVIEGKEYLSSFSDISKVYKGKGGIKLSSSKVNGAFILNFSDAGKKAITKVVVKAMKYSSDASKLKVGNATEKSISATVFTDYEFTLSSAEAVSSLKFAATKRLYISSITIYYEGGGTVTEKTAAPVISGENPFSDRTTVSITAEAGANIYYDADGMEPTVHASNLYVGPFEITKSTKVVAIAKAEGKLQSDPVTMEFTKTIDGTWILVNSASELETGGRYAIGFKYSGGTGRVVSNAAVANYKLQGTDATISGNMLTPKDDMMIFTLENGLTSGTYRLKSNNYNNTTDNYYLHIPNSQTNVNMSTSNKSDVYITYTDGSADARIQLDKSATRELMGSNSNAAVFGYYASSNTGYHKVQLYKEVDNRASCTVPTVTITPSAVIEGENATVTISGAAGENIRYTTDGSIPSSTNGTEYNGEFTLANLAKSTTVKAIAYADGKKNSSVSEATVTVTLKPRMPKVTWTVDGIGYTAENEGTYEVPRGTTLTITAVNGDKVKATNMETEESQTLTSPRTLTVNKDIMVSFASVSGQMESEPLSVMFTIKKVLPATPVVSWTLDGTTHTANNEGEYNVYAGTQITVTSENAEKIVVTNSENFNGEYDAPYTFTLNADDMFTFAGKNADGTSTQAITVAYTIVERPAEQTYRLITNASQLKAGNKYVIAYKGSISDWSYTEALSNNGNWNGGNNQYRTPLTSDGSNFTIDEDGVLHDRTFGTSSQEGIMVFTLGGTPGDWTLTADNYIVPTDVREGEEEPGSCVKLYVTSKPQAFFSMTTAHSLNTIDIASNGDASITCKGESTYVVKFDGSRFGMFKASNNYPLVQLYGLVDVPVPGTPVVTYTKTLDGEALPTTEYEAHTAINGSTITVTSANATTINVNGTDHPAVNGSYSFTTDVDEIYEVYGSNATGKSASYTVEILVDYEASSIPEMHTLTVKQPDRNNKSLNAPVKFTGWAFVTGHYMAHDMYEHVWVEDAQGNASVIFDDANGDLAETSILLERSTQIRNFVVRGVNYAGESNAMQLISWPEHIAEHVQSCDFPDIDAHSSAGKHNEFKCVRFHGDMTFDADGGVMTLSDGTKVTVSNVLTFKPKSDRQGMRFADGSFNWMPGDKWPEGTMNDVHMAGFVMPSASGYEFYPAQFTDQEGNITGVDGVSDEGAEISIEGGVINAPAGSRIFSLNGSSVQNGTAVADGVYVVVLPGGRAVKVMVQ